MEIDRDGAPPPGVMFDEAWYLSQYPGVAEFVRRGGFRSGWEHYVIHGRAEGRLPVPMTQIAQLVAAGSMPPPDGDAVPPFWNHNGTGFATPEDLLVSQTKLDRVAVVCPRSPDTAWLRERALPGCSVDVVEVDLTSPPPARTEAELIACAFVVIQISLRDLIDDDTSARVPYNDLTAYARMFQSACASLDTCLAARMRWNHEHGVLTFVTNFLVPQHNPMGRLFPRYDLRNPEYFVAELNRHLEAAVRRNYNAFVLDLDRLAASIGRRFIQADALSPLSHGAILPFETVEPGWIGPLASLAQHYDIRTGSLFPDMVWAELTAMYRTVRKADPVRLVVIEVVDTLWKSREDHEPVRDGPPVDGWPAGIAEALIYLRKRGIQLAIVSDNDELFVREIWPGIFGDGLRIEDFAAIRINWRPKSENMAELLQELNIPSRSALFIDADPAEREAMRTAFQDMRILGAFPYYLKRVLLWSPETQIIGEYDDWANRNETIRAPSASEPEAGASAPNAARPGIEALRQRLDQLWFRAIGNDLDAEDARELQRLSLAIAVTDRGVRRTHPARNQNRQ